MRHEQRHGDRRVGDVPPVRLVLLDHVRSGRSANAGSGAATRAGRSLAGAARLGRARSVGQDQLDARVGGGCLLLDPADGKPRPFDQRHRAVVVGHAEHLDVAVQPGQIHRVYTVMRTEPALTLGHEALRFLVTEQLANNTININNYNVCKNS